MASLIWDDRSPCNFYVTSKGLEFSLRSSPPCANRHIIAKNNMLNGHRGL